MASAQISTALRGHIDAIAVSQMSEKDRAPYVPPNQNWAVIGCVWPDGPCPAKQVGFIIFGTFGMEKQAQKYIARLVNEYKFTNHNLFVCKTNTWLPLPPPSQLVSDMYAQETVGKIMAANKRRILRQDVKFEQHVEEMRQAEADARQRALAGRSQVETEDAEEYLKKENEKRKAKAEELRQKYEEQVALDRVKAKILREVEEKEAKELEELDAAVRREWSQIDPKSVGAVSQGEEAKASTAQQRTVSKSRFKCVVGQPQRERPPGQFKNLKLGVKPPQMK